MPGRPALFEVSERHPFGNIDFNSSVSPPLQKMFQRWFIFPSQSDLQSEIFMLLYGNITSYELSMTYVIMRTPNYAL